MSAADVFAGTAFDTAASTLFGELYRSEMAYLLGVRKDTIRHWASGKSRIPPNVWSDIIRLLEERQAALPAILVTARKALELADLAYAAHRNHQSNSPTL